MQCGCSTPVQHTELHPPFYYNLIKQEITDSGHRSSRKRKRKQTTRSKFQTSRLMIFTVSIMNYMQTVNTRRQQTTYTYNHFIR